MVYKSQRVITYIDGFNLYYALLEKKWYRYKWLDLEQLSQNLLMPNQTLVTAKYFTARITNNPPKEQRQAIYLQALDTCPNLQTGYGHYLVKKTKCPHCGQIIAKHEEKMTDVNIAVAMLEDALTNAFDTALLISADSDLVPPIQTIKRLFPTKKIVIAFPPGRQSFALKEAADAYFTIGRRNIARSQFPDTVKTMNGFVLTKPTQW